MQEARTAGIPIKKCLGRQARLIPAAVAEQSASEEATDFCEVTKSEGNGSNTMIIAIEEIEPVVSSVNSIPLPNPVELTEVVPSPRTRVEIIPPSAPLMDRVPKGPKGYVAREDFPIAPTEPKAFRTLASSWNNR